VPSGQRPRQRTIGAPLGGLAGLGNSRTHRTPPPTRVSPDPPTPWVELGTSTLTATQPPPTGHDHRHNRVLVLSRCRAGGKRSNRARSQSWLNGLTVGRASGATREGHQHAEPVPPSDQLQRSSRGGGVLCSSGPHRHQALIVTLFGGERGGGEAPQKTRARSCPLSPCDDPPHRRSNPPRKPWRSFQGRGLLIVGCGDPQTRLVVDVC